MARGRLGRPSVSDLSGSACRHLRGSASRPAQSLPLAFWGGIILFMRALGCGVCASLLLLAGSAVAQPSPPLIGVTFTHTAVPGCDLGSNGIVLHYDRPGVRRLVRSELAGMHAAG